MLRFPHCLDNRLTDGGEIVSLTRRPLSNPQKISYIASSHEYLLDVTMFREKELLHILPSSHKSKLRGFQSANELYRPTTAAYQRR
jgi:hypothetical protein